ncbi:TolC family protein [candidate division WOR-3 bacterium]|nr:TolC family protein [candidate division WOR-3 bacterium]
MRFALTAALVLLSASAARADTLRLDADRAVELALANNRAVQLAGEKVVEAAAGRDAAFGSFLPQVSATGTYTRLGNVSEFAMASPVMGRFPIPVRDLEGNIIGFTDSIPMISGYRFDTMQLGSANNYALTGTVQQTLFTWGKLVNAYRIAGLSLDLQQAAAAQARAQVRVDAAQAFYQALLARKTAGVMAEAFQQLQRHVGQVQALYDNGLAARLDVMKATLGLQQMEAQLSQVENGAELALAALLSVLNVPAGTPVAFDEDLPRETASVELSPAVDSALARRPELVQLRDAAKMADLAERIARTANLPSVFAQANGSYRNPVGFNDDWGTDWNATVGFSMPLFTGGSNLARLKQARSKKRQAQVGLAMAEEGIRLEVQAQVAALNQEAKNIAYQARNVEVADEALKLAETRYQNGLLTNLEYLDTQLALTQSRVSYLNALASYQIARAKLQKATGSN